MKHGTPPFSIVFLVLLFCLGTSAPGGEKAFDKARAAQLYRPKRPNKTTVDQAVYEYVTPFAEAGHVEAQSVLGMMYRLHGDKQAALPWLERAAEGGDREASTQLGYLYMYGDEAGKDYEKAMRWLLRAVEEAVDPTGAMISVGELHLKGYGVSADSAKAEEWFFRAAEKGGPAVFLQIAMKYPPGSQTVRWYAMAAEENHGPAQAILGGEYQRGKWTKEDLVLAYMWLDIAAGNASNPPAGRRNAAESRDSLAERMTPEDRAQARRLSREWSERYAAAHPEE